ncbi:MAG: PAS domain-containing protein [Bacteroidetes bacterium]|nr:PAS domain-containing protein [Bacteroidota bacterium]
MKFIVLKLLIIDFQNETGVDLFSENSADLFFSFNNPIFISILVLLCIIVLSYIVINKQFVPLIKEYELEKIKMENRHTSSMAQLAEAAPDPVLRANVEGEIIFVNNAGAKLGNDLIGKNIVDLFPDLIKIDFQNFIEESSEISFEYAINTRIFNLIIKGIPNINAVQIYFNDITKIKNYEEELTASKEKLAELSSHLQTILETERSRISKELHDGIGQTLSFLSLKLDSLRNNSGEENEKRKILEELNLSINNAVMELKNISYDLKPRMLEIYGLIPTLRLLVEQISSAENIKGTFEHFDVGNLKPRLEITIFRICQELLNNIIKHSKATIFSIQILQDSNSIKLIIDDNGIGFEKPRVNYNDSKLRGMGLISITERVEAFKGNISIDSSLGNGTVVVIEFPETESFG